ncbi:hypothetical protein [Streptomyces sp. NPDC057494]|uniref:hypothetical protein n=1 Tax=Streptomyces sp. NPDC057494 TaxID=3346148 RepID=UPI00367A1F94
MFLTDRKAPAAVRHLVRAGLLTYLGGEPAHPDVHPDQVHALACRRDLPALLDRHASLSARPGRRLCVRHHDVAGQT